MQYLLLYKAYFHVSNFPNILYINPHSIYKNHSEMDTHYSYIAWLYFPYHICNITLHILHLQLLILMKKTIMITLMHVSEYPYYRKHIQRRICSVTLHFFSLYKYQVKNYLRRHIALNKSSYNVVYIPLSNCNFHNHIVLNMSISPLI